MSFNNIQDWLVSTTETILTILKRSKLRKNAKVKKRSAVIELLWTIVFIVSAVVIINMFIFQNYKIPSRSMVSTLEVGDLIFVEKMAFGPEILPGELKLPAFRSVQRGEVVSFESVDYAKSGPFVELFHRFVYVVTLSFVNLKYDSVNDDVIIDLLIKRVIGLPCERIRYRHNQWEVRPELETEWFDEESLNMQQEKPYTMIPKWETDYRTFLEQAPFDRDDYSYKQFYKDNVGRYIPEGMFFPMGDNRPDSRDAREYGPVPLEHVQGKAVFRFFPLNRAGVIE